MKEPTRRVLYKEGLHVHRTRMVRDAKKIFMSGGVEAMSAKDLSIIVDHFHDFKIDLPGIDMKECLYYLIYEEDLDNLGHKDLQEYLDKTSDLYMFLQCAAERTKRGYR